MLGLTFAIDSFKRLVHHLNISLAVVFDAVARKVDGLDKAGTDGGM
jgi:hypothetical protein